MPLKSGKANKRKSELFRNRSLRKWDMDAVDAQAKQMKAEMKGLLEHHASKTSNTTPVRVTRPSD